MTIFTLFSLVLVAVAYAAVGHGGASGYLAVLLLFNFTPDELRPLVLSMNVVVTTYLLSQTRKADWGEYRFLLLLVLFSVPAAFIGGVVRIEDAWYRVILGVLLGVSAIRLLVAAKASDELARPALHWVAIVGVLLGFVSGFTGIGGGVLLSPLLVIFRWTTIKQSIPLVAVFILFNSLAGLAGWLSSGRSLVLVEASFFVKCLGVALLGAILGSYWSRNMASIKALRYVLALVLLLASVKMIGLAF